METSLHQQLKQRYARGPAKTEVPLGKYRIDVVSRGTLIEIQHGSLAAIRDKVADLLTDHRVLVVKPIVAHKLLIKQDAKGGNVLSRRKSPKQGCLLDLFEELVYFTRVFPHPRLSLEVVLVDVEEWRYPGHGRRRRRRDRDHQIEDQKLVQVHDVHRFRTAGDLLKLIPPGLPSPFHTGHLSAALQIDRPVAQRIAYCLRKIGALKLMGKQGNTLMYRRARAKRKRSAA